MDPGTALYSDAHTKGGQHLGTDPHGILAPKATFPLSLLCLLCPPVLICACLSLSSHRHPLMALPKPGNGSVSLLFPGRPPLPCLQPNPAPPKSPSGFLHKRVLQMTVPAAYSHCTHWERKLFVAPHDSRSKHLPTREAHTWNKPETHTH